MSASLEFNAGAYVVEAESAALGAGARISPTTALRIDRTVTVAVADQRTVDACPALPVVFPSRCYAAEKLSAAAIIAGPPSAAFLGAGAAISPL